MKEPREEKRKMPKAKRGGMKKKGEFSRKWFIEFFIDEVRIIRVVKKLAYFLTWNGWNTYLSI